MKRLHNWPEQLTEHIVASRDQQFAWGRFDCALFAADAIKAMTGVDLAAEFRGKYTDEAGARALFDQALSYASSQMQTVDSGFAWRGDLVLVRNGAPEPCLGIVGLDGARALCATDRGVLHFPRTRWIQVWRVG